MAQLLPGWNALKRLGLSRTQLGDAGVTALAAALRDNRTVVQLRLHQNGISAVGIDALAAALRGNTSITLLELGGNTFGSNGAVHLFQALGGNPASALASLSVSGAGISGDVGGNLAQTLPQCRTLQSLCMSNNPLGDEALVALAAALPPGLKTLQLNSTAASDAAAVAFAAAVEGDATCNLESLELGSNNIRLLGAQALVRALSRSTALKSLYLASNELLIRDIDNVLLYLPDDGAVAVEIKALQMRNRNAQMRTIRMPERGAAAKRITL